MKNEYYQADVVIIGGGVIGTAIAHQLARYQLKTILVEKEADLASGTSKANSGIIHGGFNERKGTLKGKMNRRAVELIPDLAQQLHINYREIGSLVIAYSKEEIPVLKELYQRGIEWGYKVNLIEREELQQMEPEINSQAVMALHAPESGIISPYEMTFALAENAALNDVDFILESEVTDIRDAGQFKEVITTGPAIRTKAVINAAGLYADQIARMVGDDQFTIIPRKGEYFLYDKARGIWANHVLFRVPSAVTKGILVTPTVDGNLLIGPTSDPIEDKSDTDTSREALERVFSGARKVLPELDRREVVTQFAGLRAVIKDKEDFLIEPSANCRGMIHVAGIQSPGLTSAPAIAEYAVQLLEETGVVELEEDGTFEYRREPMTRFADLSREEQASLIDENSDYGQIICRCEYVTRAEIIDAINRPVGARTVGGVKRRARAGMGRCQGGFCGPRIVELLSKYAGVDKINVTKKGKDSYLLKSRTKMGEGVME